MSFRRSWPMARHARPLRVLVWSAGGVMTNSGEMCLHLSGWGTARAELNAIAALRKSLPAWAPQSTPGHFLKHADEQTVLAVAALDHAIQTSERSAGDFRQCAIIAAPRFIGRINGCATLGRYTAGG